MGRYYYGDIEGKFWFGIQSSADPKYLGCYVDPDKHDYLYGFCDCPVEDTDITWCMNCFDCREQHVKECIAMYEDWDADRGLFYESENRINWIFYAEDVDKLKTKLTSDSFYRLGHYKIPMDEFIDMDSINFNSDNGFAYGFEYMESAEQIVKEVVEAFKLGATEQDIGVRNCEYAFIMLPNSKEYSERDIIASAFYKSKTKTQRNRFHNKLKTAFEENKKIFRYLLGLQILEFFKRNPDVDACCFTGDV